MKTINILFFILGFFTIFLFWYIGNYFLESKVPAFNDVMYSIYINKNIHVSNILSTVYSAFLGLIISIAFSLMIVFAVAIYRPLEYLFSPFIILIKTSPVVAFVPIFMHFFGTGRETIVLSSAMICFFPLIIGGFDGMLRVPQKLSKYVAMYTRNKLKMFWHIKFKYILESSLSSLKVAAPLSIVGAIVGEYVVGGQASGLGAFIYSNTAPYAIKSKYVGVVLASSLGIFFYGIAYLLHQYYSRSLNLEK